MKKRLIRVILICLAAACFSGTAMAAESQGAVAAESQGTVAAESRGAVEAESQGTVEAESQGTVEAESRGAEPAEAEAGNQPTEESRLTDVSGGAPIRSVEGEWSGDGEDWQYLLPNGECLEKDWLNDGGKWYYFDGDGYMVTGLRRIGGKYYFFRWSGEMAVGWAYDGDEDKWYYMNEDGTITTGWLYTGGAWYWFDSKGVMYHEGFRMVSGHKYYFFENGQMAAGQYIGTNYYGTDGLRDRQYDMKIQGKRKPSQEERDAIAKAMEGIPGEWVEKCLKSGWEFMFYTDKDYFSAPKTDQGIYYVYHKTDVNYKKIKFTRPEALKLAFGEYVAWATGNDKETGGFMVDLQQYLSDSSYIQPLPSYFDDKSGMWFGLLFEGYCDPEIRYDIRVRNPGLAVYVEEALGTDFSGLRPSEKEIDEQTSAEETGGFGGSGPVLDEELKKKKDGPGQ